MKPPIGIRLIDSTPEQTNSRPASIWIAPAAMWIACIDEPQKRLSVTPATPCGSPASVPASRATFKPCSASGKGAAGDVVLDRLDLGTARRDEAAHDLGQEVVRAGAGERPLVRRLEGRAGVARDDDGSLHRSQTPAGSSAARDARAK